MWLWFKLLMWTSRSYSATGITDRIRNSPPLMETAIIVLTHMLKPWMTGFTSFMNSIKHLKNILILLKKLCLDTFVRLVVHGLLSLMWGVLFKEAIWGQWLIVSVSLAVFQLHQPGSSHGSSWQGGGAVTGVFDKHHWRVRGDRGQGLGDF